MPGPPPSSEQSERVIFGAFKASEPSFADEEIKDWYTINEWYTHTKGPRPDPPNHDRPDIICITKSQRVIGVELGSWLHEGQISDAKRQEYVERSMLDAIGTQPPNQSEHISFVGLRPNYQQSVSSDEAGSFRNELFDLINEADRRWLNERFWQSPQGCSWSDFSSRPTLGKYLDTIKLMSRKHNEYPDDQDWITPPARGGFYSHESGLEAVSRILDDKINKYDETTKTAVGLNEFYLLVHYDQALIYNDPLETPLFKFEDAVRYVQEQIGQNTGAFDKIFLFKAFKPPHDQVFRLA